VNAFLHNDRGWTLVELLVAMTLMLIVLSATLTSFNAFSNNTKRNFDFNDQQDQVRNTLDLMVRQARTRARTDSCSRRLTPRSSGSPTAWTRAHRRVG
jgi:prepilin-type N-terminal cleavage/methylation domain-containing protein